MQLNLNLSLMLNLLFLMCVAIAIVRTWRARRGARNFKMESTYRGESNTPSLSIEDDAEDESLNDLISVRKVEPVLPSVMPIDNEDDNVGAAADVSVAPIQKASVLPNPTSETVMIFLLAKEQRQFTGYALLQTLLSAGLRFGEGNLFHRHQSSNGQGLVLFSLASATASGVFDLQNMGACSVKGLCLFMHASGNSVIDEERFNLMIDVACQLTEELDAYMLDDRKQPWTQACALRYQQRLQVAFKPAEEVVV